MDDRQRSEGRAVTTVLGRIIVFILDSMFDQYLWPLWRKVAARLHDPTEMEKGEEWCGINDCTETVPPKKY